MPHQCAIIKGWKHKAVSQDFLLSSSTGEPGGGAAPPLPQQGPMVSLLPSSLVSSLGTALRLSRHFPFASIVRQHQDQSFTALHSSALQRKSHLCIPFVGVASVPISTFMCLGAIYTVYSQIGLHIWLQQNRQTDPGNI